MSTVKQESMSSAAPGYDRELIPAEVTARKEREGKLFSTTAKTDKQVNPQSIDTAGGYTIDQEGLANNYAVEPEMYVNQPGDLRQQNAELAAKRARELSALAGRASG